MKMGDFIKENRKAKRLTQEEFGGMFFPPVNRAAISKWEKGHVTNIKRSQIQKMCEIFGCAPSELMCFNEFDKIYIEKITKESDVYDKIKECFGETAVDFIRLFANFNIEGQEKLLDMAIDMAKLDRYKKYTKQHVIEDNDVKYVMQAARDGAAVGEVETTAEEETKLTNTPLLNFDL